MSRRPVWVVGAWLVLLAIAALAVARARYITDLSAFLPDHPTPQQQLLVDQLRDGPASRLILIAIEGGTTSARGSLSSAMTAILRRDPRFNSVDNGEAAAGQRDREFLFDHRYVLSDAVDAEHFSVSGLHEALALNIDALSSAAGMALKSLLPRDPTGELLHLLEQLASNSAPQTRDGVWVSADGLRALAIAQTAARGSDSDAQARALTAIRAAFDASAVRAGAVGVALRLSGPAVFAVAARAKIERAALRLSVISGVLVIVMLLMVYRSLTVLLLGLLPVATAALLGVAAVAVVFGAVHGITLGFGVTLIGESVDYSIYFFIQSRTAHASGDAAWQRRWWPTVRLGMLTSVCGFASLLPSGFPGLKQLGLYSISGLIAAALVTRFVLPLLLPQGFAARDTAALGAVLLRWLREVQRPRRIPVSMLAWPLAATALCVLVWHRHNLWNRELSALSPVPIAEQNFDAQLRADLGAADVRDLVVVSAPDMQSVLAGAERVAHALKPLMDAAVLGSVDNPAQYLPSVATQEMRRGSLPAPAQLHDNLRDALQGLPLREARLQPFLEDVEATRHGPLVGLPDLQGTELRAGFDSMMLHQAGRWNALLPLHGAHLGQDIDLRRVAMALEQPPIGPSPPAGRPPPAEVHVLDLKQESDALYSRYLAEAIRLSLAGFAALTVLLAVTLRSAMRVARVLGPLLLAVLAVAALLAASGVELTILHLVGMLLIVAVGSNYALFFDRQAHAHEASTAAATTLASLAVANAGTVIGFGLLSFSQVPVLVALGTTVAPGAFLALLFSALLIAPPAMDDLQAASIA